MIIKLGDRAAPVEPTELDGTDLDDGAVSYVSAFFSLFFPLSLAIDNAIFKIGFSSQPIGRVISNRNCR